MWFRISLRLRIYIALTALAGITVAGGSVMVWYTHRMERLLGDIIDRDIAAFQVVEALETALVSQKGFVSYYFLDGDPDWLRRLGEYRQIFKERMAEAERLVNSPAQREALTRIETEYQRYIADKDQVIDYYKTGQREVGSRLHAAVRNRFFRIMELCETYKGLYADRIVAAGAAGAEEARRLRFIAAGAIFAEFALAIMLVFVLIHHIFGPVRRLTQAAEGEGAPRRFDDEIKALSRSVHGLIRDAGQTHQELARSREHLLQSEKMAMVGRLAAGTAHSIRNPLTSVKMRLFSLSRSLGLTDTQKEDFDVISQEIRHIDTILQNFLEFSRPPKLKFQRVSPSSVVDMAIQLLEHRLKSYDVTVAVRRARPLPLVRVDPEQLKEVLVNLMVNACEAMGRGGHIEIGESVEGAGAVIRVADDGPGMPEAVVEKAFQPFFTTKDEGTGLGLSIALRIIEEHMGEMTIASQEGAGATFAIALPLDPEGASGGRADGGPGGGGGGGR